MAGMTTAALGLGMSAFQIGKGIVDDKKAAKDLANLETPDLDNAFNKIQISTIGSDYMKEQNAIGFSSALDSLRSGGVRSVMGGVPKLASFYDKKNEEGRAYLDEQVIERDYAIAGDDARIRQMNEQRYLGDVAGLGNARGVAQQNIWSGARGAMASLGYASDNGLFTKKDKTTG